MSFGFGSGGFGQNNTNTPTFGGFGSTNPSTNTGFGSSGSTAFGSTTNTATPGGGLFGGGGGFGSNTTGAFGSGGFGSKPAFGTPTTTSSGGGLFGTTTATSGPSGFGTGGFGSSTSTSSPFGGASLFGGNKPATTTGFGTGTSTFGGGTGGSIFGGGTTTGTTGFGATNNPGIGANVGDPPGTAVVPFSPTVEKEVNNPSQSNSFQNILFMDAYKKWSAEELRLADYNQGRKTGSPGGTGAFGSSGFGTSGFGTNTGTTGFGTTSGTGIFGSTQPTTGGFGATNTTNTGGFGSGGGIFGSKPATGGVFGSTTTQPAQSGGLFGTAGFGSGSNTTGAFGSGTTNTAGGLFGNANANKPAGFGFGSTGGTTGFGTTSTAPAFGTTTSTTNTGGGLFGANNQTTSSGGGLFGGQQQTTSTPFGSTGTNLGTQGQTTGTSLFGNQQKPGGLFGSATNTGQTGGLFGNTGTTTSSPFGAATTTQPATGGLFGQKPASAGTGLFGNTSTTAQPSTTGGGLFGNLGTTTQAQQPAQGSLFGGLGQNQSKPLFGGSTTTGGGLFGQTTQSQTGGGLFGTSTNQQQPQTNTLGGSLLGASQAQQAPQQPFSTTINDISAYGAATLFSGLPDDKIQNPGPLATPLSGKSKAKSRSILPMYKLSPANASRFVTPQKRGFGLPYSTYGSPASPSSVSSTPGGLGQSLLAGSLNRRLSKSISASNLRRSFNVEDSILQPGAFSASSSMRLLGSSNNHKKLIINKDMRSDLFTSPNKEKSPQEDANGARKLPKRVSFDTSTVENADDRETAQGAAANGSSTDDLGYLKPSSGASTNGVNGTKSSPVASTPEMEQVKGNELAVVHEEESPAQVRNEKKPSSSIEPGAYWMAPTADEIRAMNRMQRQKVSDFTVGRENVGSITFKVPVDLSSINLDEIFDNIVVLIPRSATVYPTAAKKPPVGKGLNVPAVIALEHSYPRGGLGVTGRRLERHIEKLKMIPDTKFEDYDKETGVWTFSVEHFTTYGLGDDDDDDDETAVEPIHSGRPAPSPSAAKDSASPADPDDTFEFRRKRRAVPGAFDDAELSDNEEATDTPQRQGTLSPEPQEADAPLPSREWPEDESMADGPDEYQLEASEQLSQQGLVEEQDEFPSRYDDTDAQVPAGIMRARIRAVKKSTAPTKIEVTGGDDWTQILQASVRAPRTVDRATLRALNESGAVWEMKDRGSPAPQKNAAVPDGAGFATSIDLMKSLFEQAKGPTQPVQATPAKGFVKWPYEQRPKVDDDEGPTVPRPSWGPNELLVTAHRGEPSLQLIDGNLEVTGETTASAKTLARLQHYIDIVSGKGDDQSDSGPDFRELAQGDSVWELASLLFDDDGVGLPAFWKRLVSEATDRALAEEPGLEEKAIICLSGNRVADACGHLLAAANFRLATLVSSIGMQNKDIRAQLKDWRESNVLAEFSEPVRAIYELLAGNACVCAGVKNVPIENRVNSFTISERFGLDWMQSFGLRLFYTSGRNVAEAVRSFQADIEQDREPEPDSALWSLLKAFANREFDWSDTRLGWLMTKAIYATGKVAYGEDAAEKLDMASLSFAPALTAQSHWVPATFVLLQLSDPSSREAAVRDHLGRHAHRIGSARNPNSAFAALRKFGVPENWIWEAKALDFRSRQDAQREFLSLMWAGNYAEANQAFVNRVGPDLVIERDFKRLFAYAQLLFRVRKRLPDWDRAAAVYLLYPMARLQNKHQPLDRFDNQLFDGLVALRGAAHGDVRQEAAIADMAEELIRCRGGDARLFQLLPQDVRGKYMRAQALENIR
ncbi:hypothetical protein VTK56DRAFT_4865 [Thermocarpiscus australiensis]